MVLKRKLPTQAKQEEKKVEQEEKNVDQFDMSIEGDKQEKSKSAEDLAGTDVVEDSSMQTSAKPEDFIPEELRAMEAESEKMDIVEEPAKEIAESKDDFEDQDVMNVFDEQPARKESFEEPIINEIIQETPIMAEETTIVDEKDSEIDDSFESEMFGSDEYAEPAELPGGPVSIEEPAAEEPAFDSFEKIETSSVNDEADDSFENISWDDSLEETSSTENIQDSPIETKEKDEFSESNIPNLDEDVLSSVELMGEDHQLLTLNNDAKKKLILGIIAIMLIAGAVLALTGKEDSSRWMGVLNKKGDTVKTDDESSLMFTETEENDDSTKIAEFKEEDDTGFNLLNSKGKKDDAETQINLLDPEVVETTSSGKEIIKADEDEKVAGEDEILKELEQEEKDLEADSKAEETLSKEDKKGINLLESISSEIKKQKEAQGELTVETPDDSKKDDKTPQQSEEFEDANKQVDKQLEDYRKLLAGQEDPGKKVKPGAFFSGEYKKGGSVEKSSAIPATSATSATRVDLERGTATLPEDYVLTNKEVAGHQIVEYPKPITREVEQGIRTLDDFRTSIVKKQDKRVRVPRHLKPALRNQGFPKLKVISIVPNYGLVAVYNSQKGALMIGDSIQGWELVGVYRTYAEFKLGNRKHIITLTR